MCSSDLGKILDLVGYAWSGFGAAFGPVILFSLFWKRMTRNAAVAGVIAGGLTVVVWPFTGSTLFDVIPGFIVGSIAVYVMTLLDNPVSPAVAALFEKVQQEVEKRQHTHA